MLPSLLQIRITLRREKNICTTWFQGVDQCLSSFIIMNFICSIPQHRRSSCSAPPQHKIDLLLHLSAAAPQVLRRRVPEISSKYEIMVDPRGKGAFHEICGSLCHLIKVFLFEDENLYVYYFKMMMWPGVSIFWWESRRYEWCWRVHPSFVVWRPLSFNWLFFEVGRMEVIEKFLSGHWIQWAKWGVILLWTVCPDMGTKVPVV